MSAAFSILFSLVTSLPVYLIKFIRVNYHLVRLQQERAEIKDIRELRNQELESLRYGSSNLLSVFLGSSPIQFAIAEGQENYLRIRCRLFNGSCFRIAFDDTKCDVNLNGRLLAFNAVVENSFSSLNPGQIGEIHFRLPIQEATTNTLRKAVSDRNELKWRFEFRSKYEIAAENVGGDLSENLVLDEIPIR